MHAELKELPAGTRVPSPTSGRIILICLSILFISFATLSAWNIIVGTTKSTDAIDRVLSLYSLKNEGAKTLQSFKQEHPLLGWLFGSPVKKALALPSAGVADEALSSDVRDQLSIVRKESFKVAWWSWSFITASLVYFAIVITVERRFTSRAVIFCLMSISTVCFIIGVLAPAMVMWTAPSIPMESGNLQFVLQHKVRGIAAIIWELLTGDQWLIGAFLLLFSIITPLTKATLTFFVTFSYNHKLNEKIGHFIHTIGRWSMADVFVAGVFLALFALKAQEATKSIPCLGIYYFLLYCLVSLSTTQLLVHSEAIAPVETNAKRRRLGPTVISSVYAVVALTIVFSGIFTYQQYTQNMHDRITAPSTPQQLNNASLVLPAHK